MNATRISNATVQYKFLLVYCSIDSPTGILIQNSVFLKMRRDSFFEIFTLKPFLGEQATLVTVSPITEDSDNS